MKVEIFHIYHSGVAVKVGDKILIFDYFQGPLSDRLFSDQESVYVFVSHSHNDHFNPHIFDWQRKNPRIKYILSADLEVDGSRESYYSLQQDEELKVNDLVIKTFGSTDLGLSFLVRVSGISIFHAGDLNWWHWKSFTKEEQKREEEDFKREVAKVKENKIDIAFVPVDPRLEEYYFLAGKYFAEELKPRLLVPIHFGDDFAITNKFAEKIRRLPVEAAIIGKKGEKIVFKK